jgi:hypothetical protein
MGGDSYGGRENYGSGMRIYRAHDTILAADKKTA